MSCGCEYIITFHTHYEALVCKRTFEKIVDGGSVLSAIKLIPVPRELSSSCGTALKVEAENMLEPDFFSNIEKDDVFVLSSDGKYSLFV